MQESASHPNTVDEYISQYPENVQQVLNKIRAVVKETAPEAREKISYGMAGYYLNGGLVWFGAYKRHIGFYPKTPAMDVLKDEITPFEGTKGSLHFPLDKSIPYALISKLVQIRLEENSKI